MGAAREIDGGRKKEKSGNQFETSTTVQSTDLELESGQEWWWWPWGWRVMSNLRDSRGKTWVMAGEL